MIIETRTVKANAGGVENEFTVNCPETLEEAQNLYGLSEKEIIGSSFDNFVIKLQAFLRAQLKAGKPVNDLQTMVDGWKPEPGRASSKTPLVNSVVEYGLLPKTIAETLTGKQLQALIDSYNSQE